MYHQPVDYLPTPWISSLAHLTNGCSIPIVRRSAASVLHEKCDSNSAWRVRVCEYSEHLKRLALNAETAAPRLAKSTLGKDKRRGMCQFVKIEQRKDEEEDEVKKKT